MSKRALVLGSTGQDAAQIKLSGRNNLYATVDFCDLDAVAAYKWYPLFKPGRIYARANLSRANGQPPRSLMLHRLIAERAGFVIAGKQTDHKDRNGLNNRRKNLRSCTQSRNSMNKRKQVTAKCPFKGVSFTNKKWRARITFEGRTIHLGYFRTAQDAAKAYDKAAHDKFGEFALSNKKLELV